MESRANNVKEKVLKYAENKRKNMTLPNVTIPPPPLPPNYSTMIYPKYADKLKIGVPAELQMKEISLNWRNNETNNIMDLKKPDWKLIRDKNQNYPRYSSICSEATSVAEPKPRVIYHTHNSSLQYRITAPNDTWGNYPCITCKATPHSCKTGLRYPLLMTSSILNGWQGKRYENEYIGDDIHLECVGIPGGTVKSLHHAFCCEYSNQDIIVDVLLVAGLNDILHDTEPGDIIEEMRRFRASVYGMKKLKHCSPGSFAAACLPLPPKIAVLPKENRKLRSNKYDDLCLLNEMIKIFNREETISSMPTVWAPRFYTWGLKDVKNKKGVKIGPRERLASKVGVRKTHYREDKACNMLHLSDKKRLDMGKSCLKYFMYIYKIIIRNESRTKVN